MNKSYYQTEVVSCNLCKEDRQELIYDLGGLNIVKCRNCGLMYTNPRLTKESLFKLYNGEYYTNPKFYDKSDQFLYGYEDYTRDKGDIQASLQKIFKVIDQFKKPGRLLEIGCAMGFFLEMAKKRGWDGYGFEVSRSACEYTQNVLNLNVLNGEFKSAEFPPHHFDAVALFDVVEHLQDPLAELERYKRALKDNGLLVLSTLNADSPIAKLLGRRWEDIRRNKVHLYIFSKRTIISMLDRAGFEVLYTQQYGRYFNLAAIIKRLSVYGERLSGIARSICDLLRISDRRFYIVPFTKIIIYAKRKKE